MPLMSIVMLKNLNESSANINSHGLQHTPIKLVAMQIYSVALFRCSPRMVPGGRSVTSASRAASSCRELLLSKDRMMLVPSVRPSTCACAQCKLHSCSLGSMPWKHPGEGTATERILKSGV